MRNGWLAGIVVGVLAACGPAPGYGPDGHLIQPGQYDNAYAPNGRAVAPGYAAPQQQAYGQAQQVQPTPAYPAPAQSPSQPPPPAQAQPVTPPPFDFSQAQPVAPDPGPAPVAAACDDSCRFARNGECDDGRSGSDTDLCGAGTDCSDCGGAPR